MISYLHLNPMLTREKPNSVNRRVIVDMSWPLQQSVNYNVCKDTYLGTPFQLRYPSIDDITDHIIHLKGQCVLYKVDLQRAFRQLKLDLRDIKYTGLGWKGKFYVDTSIPFGYRHGSLNCQSH